MTRESDLGRRSAEIWKFFRSTPCNKATVSQFLHDADSEKEQYNAEINKFKFAIYMLEKKRDTLEKTAKLFKSLLAPIYTLPSEILTIIFAFACEENVLSRSKLPEAARLSMVCGRWRDLAHTTPSLWSNISIDFQSWKQHFSILNRLTELFMERSAKSPLQIHLSLPDDGFSEDRSEKDEAYSVLRPVVANCQRWRCVSFSTISSSIADVLSPVRGRLPLLTSLGFDCKGASASSIPFPLFDNCPALHTLHITSAIPRPFQTEAPPFPWRQITSLRLATLYNISAFPVLSLCPSVEHLELYEVGGTNDESQDYSDHVVSSDIRSLTITSALDQSDVDGVFQHTTLKGLSSLKICGGMWSMSEQTTWLEWNETRLHDFLQRSSCTITSLHLKNLPITDDQTLSLLRMMPGISSLCIEELRNEGENRIVTKTLLDGLDVKGPLAFPASAPLVPRLAELKLVVHAKDLHSDPFMKALLCRWLSDPNEARELGVDCLRSVVIVAILGPDQEGGLLDSLLELRDAGMRLVITYGKVSELYPHD
ncbi:hypothetical protein V5O48_011758 [Marasmius crinis-equi]|uniref:F-box domain-containing protein n=1 Tax=Marasmius crinis-equi TaxID=585013 RepID=A0ABR3F4R2_9AGAR